MKTDLECLQNLLHLRSKLTHAAVAWSLCDTCYIKLLTDKQTVSERTSLTEVITDPVVFVTTYLKLETSRDESWLEPAELMFDRTTGRSNLPAKRKHARSLPDNDTQHRRAGTSGRRSCPCLRHPTVLPVSPPLRSFFQKHDRRSSCYFHSTTSFPPFSPTSEHLP